jgi:hypothetical protein
MNGAPTAAGRWVSAINFYYAAPVHYLLIELPLRVVWSLPGAAAAPPAPRARRAAGVEGWNRRGVGPAEAAKMIGEALIGADDGSASQKSTSSRPCIAPAASSDINGRLNC